MAIEWSREQKRIIEADGGNLLASASAGSGKTTVMLERARRLIVDKRVPVRRIVMLSFNKAIAKEIKLRLIETLEKEVIERPYLAAEIDAIETAQITTIDGFCHSLISEYFENLDIGADCAIIEGSAQQTMLNGVIAGIIKDLKTESDDKIYGMIQKFGGEKNLSEAICGVYNFSCVVPDREEWLAKACSPPKRATFDDIFTEYIELLNKRHRSELADYAELLYLLDPKSAPYTILEMHLNAMTDILKADSYSALYKTKLDYEPLLGGRLTFKKDEAFDIESAKARINLLRANVKSVFDNVECDYQTEYDKYRKSQADAAELARYALLAHEAFGKLKKSLGVLDFADLTYYAAKLLKDDAVSEEIAAKYDYVFIDEYQDTNYIGEYILSRISRNNLFMVGDAKQSIYGFRLAEPRIMINKIESMKLADTEGRLMRRELTCVNLNDNYRSDKRVLEFVNGIFDVIMTKYNGGIEYASTDRLIGKADYKNTNDIAPCEVSWVYAPKCDETQQKSALNGVADDKDGLYNPFDDTAADKENHAAIAEGKTIAAAIKRFIGCEIYDAKKGLSRKAEPRDICLLSRYCIKNGNRTEKVIKTIQSEGISVSIDGLIKREDADEVAVLIEMLKVIDNDTQEIPLAAALKSVWCGMTSAELAELRRRNPSAGFYQAVQSERGNNEKITKFYNIIEEMRVKSAYGSVYDIASALIYKYGYDKALIAQKIGMDTVRDYIDGLRDYSGTLSEFVNSATLRYDSAADGGVSSRNSVKAMTIHASKGLEFPIVILMGADEKFRRINKTLAVDKDYCVAVDLYDENKMVKSDNFVIRTLKKFQAQKESDEEMRLLYVALTRAKNHLLITGAVGENSLSIDDYTAPYNVTSYREWICNAVAKGGISRKFVNVTEVGAQTADTAVMPDEPLDIDCASDEIDRVINFKYPYQASTKLGLKHTVTELITPDSYEDIPIFSGFYDPETEKAARGTNYHVILEHIDYSAVTRRAVEDELKRMVSENLLDEEQTASVNVDEIVRLMNSEIMDSARSDNAVYMREKQFMLRAKASEFYGCGDDDEILIQGAIDLIIDADKLIVVDFKKSRKNRAGLIAAYSRQLDIYARAVEQAMGKKVDKKFIYEIGRGEIIEL